MIKAKLLASPRLFEFCSFIGKLLVFLYTHLERLRCGDIERLLLRSLSRDLDLSRRLLSRSRDVDRDRLRSNTNTKIAEPNVISNTSSSHDEKLKKSWVVVAHAFNPRTGEAEAGGSL